jgi:hypothetical protein
MLKVYTTPYIEDAIRKQASKLGVPYSHYLAPFLKAIADGQLLLTPQLAHALPTLSK